MLEPFLNLKDASRTIDFLAEFSTYADLKTRQRAEKIVKEYEEGKVLLPEKLAEEAHNLALAAWPARLAVERFFTHEGSEEEWNLVLAALRPSTAHLLRRFRRGINAKSLDAVLGHVESGSALREEERLEIAEVRKQVRQDFWQKKKDTLKILYDDYQRELEGYVKRLKTLRELALASAPTLQDELFSKLEHLEDRILFAGEIVPLEILDEEIAYYTDQKEISPFE